MKQGSSLTDQQQLHSDTKDVLFPWKTGYQQDVGSRKEQQDTVDVIIGEYRDKPALLAVLADGMGGMRDGAKFSKITVDYHREYFQKTLNQSLTLPFVLLALALRANAEANQIYDDDYPGGTTLVSALFYEDYFYTLSVGDSRITLFRKNREERLVPLQINREHLLGAVLDERAWMGYISHEDAEDNMFRNSLISSIGAEKVKRIDFTDYKTFFLPGDQLLLMSDGVFKTVPETELGSYLMDEPEIAADRILQAVKDEQKRNQDNMSVIIIQKMI